MNALLGRLKARIRVWLEIPSEQPHRPRKASGAMYAEIRAARAEVLGLREAVADAQLGLRSHETAVLLSSANYENTLSEVADLHKKLDAVFEALGFVVVANEEGPASVLPLDQRALRTERVLAAREVARQLDALLVRAKVTEGLFNERARRILAMREAVKDTDE
jgi:hypothetical protein